MNEFKSLGCVKYLTVLIAVFMMIFGSQDLHACSRRHAHGHAEEKQPLTQDIVDAERPRIPFYTLAETSTPTAVDKVDAYYQEQIEKDRVELSRTEKYSSALVASTGMISLWFLGADLAGKMLGSEAAGYAIGPLFELPIACLAYGAQNSVYKECKKIFNKKWNSISKTSLSREGVAKGAYLLTLGTLGTAMATTAVYYTDYYVRHFIGDSVWLLIPSAAVSNALMAGAATHGLLSFFKQSTNTYVLKACKSEKDCRRDELKDRVDSHIRYLKQATAGGDSIEDTATFQTIQDGHISNIFKFTPDAELEAITATETVAGAGTGAVDTEPFHDRTQDPGYKRMQAAAGVVGGVVAIVGSYAMLESTKMASKFILTSWCGVDPSTAETIAQGCGYLGGLTMGLYRGHSSKGTFQRLHELIDSTCRSGKCSGSAKGIAAETANWVLGFISVAPRVQIVLDAINKGALQQTVMVGNIIATTCNDYYGWKKVPTVARDLVHQKTDEEKTIQTLEDFKGDIDSMNDEVIAALCSQTDEESKPE